MMLLRKIYYMALNMLPLFIKRGVQRSWLVQTCRRASRQRQFQSVKNVREKSIAKNGICGPDELFEHLRSDGITEGDTLFVQCSFNNLHTFGASPLELLTVLERLVGISGTLLMPAYTEPKCPGKIFKPANEPTYAGIVNEIFRRSPDVIRSSHTRHSICGRGPLAKEILADHETSARADGAGSPFDKIRLLPNAKILTLGLPAGYLSFLHWVEDIEPEKLPFPVSTPEPTTNMIELPNGSLASILDWPVKPSVARRLSLRRISTRLTPNCHRYYQYKGINIGVYVVAPLAEELLALRDRGIIHYK
ncbi:MAG: AAC(3) family N-acetyltransferase [Burkholderiaceae bacterium]